jgi:hypothetical protein
MCKAQRLTKQYNKLIEHHSRAKLIHLQNDAQLVSLQIKFRGQLHVEHGTSLRQRAI